MAHGTNRQLLRAGTTRGDRYAPDEERHEDRFNPLVKKDLFIPGGGWRWRSIAATNRP